MVEKSLQQRPRSFLIGDNLMDSAAVGNMLKRPSKSRSTTSATP